jgi:hypothetical protein
MITYRPETNVGSICCFSNSFFSPQVGALAPVSATKKIANPIRVHIDMSDKAHVRYWTKHLRISDDELQKAIDKVGNSAAAVRKQLALYRQNQLTAGQ